MKCFGLTVKQFTTVIWQAQLALLYMVLMAGAFMLLVLIVGTMMG